MWRKKILILATAGIMLPCAQGVAQEPSFADRLSLDPAETCSSGAPAAGDIVALALRGAKGENYVIAGNSQSPRLAVRGPATTAFSVFVITETALESSVAIHSLGHLRFLSLDEEARVFANAEPARAVPFVFEETGDGYFRVRLHDHAVWLRMSANGYLDFRTRDVDGAAQFCAQSVVSE